MNYYVINAQEKLRKCKGFRDALNKYFNLDGGEIYLTDGKNYYDKICNDWEVNAEMYNDGFLIEKEKKILLDFCKSFSAWEIPACVETFLENINK